MTTIASINHLDMLNVVLCAGMVIHGVCLAYHFTKKTPCIERFSVALYTAGFAAIAIGPWFGYTTTDPAEVATVAGLLFYTVCKEWRRAYGDNYENKA